MDAADHFVLPPMPRVERLRPARRIHDPATELNHTAGSVEAENKRQGPGARPGLAVITRVLVSIFRAHHQFHVFPVAAASAKSPAQGLRALPGPLLPSAQVVNEDPETGSGASQDLHRGRQGSMKYCPVQPVTACLLP